MRQLVPEFVLNKININETEGIFDSFCLVIDLKGFTELTEELLKYDKLGAEALSDIIEKVFNPMIEIIHNHDGFVSSFAGDSITAIIPDNKNDKIIELFLILEKINNLLNRNKNINYRKIKFDVKAKISAAYGEIKWFINVENGRGFYYFLGEGLRKANESVKLSRNQEIIIDDRIRERIEKYSKSIKILETRGNYFVLKTFMLKKISNSIKIKNKPLAVPENIDKQGYFYPDLLLYTKNKAEFRYVTSCFINFEIFGEQEEVINFIKEIMFLTKKYNGYFNKIDYGDKGGIILLVFGAPITYENALDNALELFLDLRDKKVNLRWRAGISSGMAYSGFIGPDFRCEYTVLGDSINVASRIMQSADFYSVRINKKSFLSSYERFNTEYLGEKNFKGKSDTTSVYELRNKKDIKVNKKINNYIRKDKNFEDLLNYSKEIFTDRVNGVINIYGDSSTGKTRFLKEYINTYLNEYKIRNYYINCENNSSFQPVRTLLKNIFQYDGRKDTTDNLYIMEKIYQGIIDRLGDGDTVNKIMNIKNNLFNLILMKNVSESLYYDENIERIKELASSILIFLKILLKLEKLCIIFDDAENIDELTISFIKELNESQTENPFLIIFSSRKPLTVGTNWYRKINLKNLSLNECGNYIKNLLETKNQIPDELIRDIYDKTSGNTFYIEQLINYYLENKILVLENKGVLFDHNNKNKYSMNIEELIISRLDKLDLKVRKTVLLASVIGKEFKVSLLQALTGDSETKNYLQKLEDIDFCNKIENERYAFNNSLIRNTIYNLQIGSELRESHKKAAETYVNLYNNSPEYFSIIGYHFEKSVSYAKAAQYYLMAADYFKDKYLYPNSIEYYSKFIDIYNKYLFRSQTINYQMYVDAINNRGESFYFIANWDDAEKDYLEALEKSQKIGETKTTLKIYGNLGVINLLKGRFDEAEKYLNIQLNRSYKTQDKKITASALGNLGRVQMGKSRYNEAMEYYEWQLELSKEIQDKIQLAYSYSNIGMVYRSRGDFDKALENYIKQYLLGKEIKDKKIIASAFGNLGLINLNKKNYKAAIYYFNQRLRLAEEIEDKHAIATTCGHLGIIYLQIHQIDNALNYLNRRLDLTRLTGDIIGYARTILNLGIIYDEMDDNEKSLECYEYYLSEMEKIGDKRSMALAYENIGGINRKINNFEEAEKFFDRAYKLYTEINLRLGICDVLHEKAELFYQMGKYYEAMSINQQALQLSTKLEYGEVTYNSKFLYAKLIALNDGESAVYLIEELIENETLPEKLAELYYEKWKIEQKEIDRYLSRDYFQKAYKLIPKKRYKLKIEELKEKSYE